MTADDLPAEAGHDTVHVTDLDLNGAAEDDVLGGNR